MTASHDITIPDGMPCPECGYDLTAAPEPRCAECGRLIALGDVDRHTYRTATRLRHSRSIPRCAVGWLVAIVLCAAFVGVLIGSVDAMLGTFIVLTGIVLASVAIGVLPASAAPRVDRRLVFGGWFLRLWLLHVPWLLTAPAALLFVAAMLISVMETTLIILKPDAVQRGLMGQIITRFEDKGLQIVGAKMMQISQRPRRDALQGPQGQALLRRARRLHDLEPRARPRHPRRRRHRHQPLDDGRHLRLQGRRRHHPRRLRRLQQLQPHPRLGQPRGRRARAEPLLQRRRGPRASTARSTSWVYDMSGGDPE
jgi:hypothetical protein